jgi:Arm DNA-binding domain
VTGGGLYLFVTPDESRLGNVASKLWWVGYRFHSRQKTYSIGPCGNGKDGTFSLAEARRERDKAKDLLKEGKDPSTEKQLDKHRPIQVAEWIVAVAFDLSIIADLLIDTAHAVAGFQLSFGFVKRMNASTSGRLMSCLSSLPKRSRT